jgi:hypothetical protein
MADTNTSIQYALTSHILPNLSKHFSCCLGIQDNLMPISTSVDIDDLTISFDEFIERLAAKQAEWKKVWASIQAARRRIRNRKERVNAATVLR